MLIYELQKYNFEKRARAISTHTKKQERVMKYFSHPEKTSFPGSSIPFVRREKHKETSFTPCRNDPIDTANQGIRKRASQPNYRRALVDSHFARRKRKGPEEPGLYMVSLFWLEIADRFHSLNDIRDLLFGQWPFICVHVFTGCTPRRINLGK